MPSTSAAHDLVTRFWSEQGLPQSALDGLRLTGPVRAMPSSFNVTALAQANIALCALSAAQISHLRTSLDRSTAPVTIDSRDAAAEFRVERLALIGGQVGSVWDKLAGQYKARDGWLRPHVNWRHHRLALLDMLGLPEDVSREQLSQKLSECHAIETAERAMTRDVLLTAMRSFEQDATEHGKATASEPPLSITKLCDRPPKPFRTIRNPRRPLQGVRVLDLTRVIAGPTAGRTLAGYGADVLWVTAPHLPTLPDLDCDTSRGKRTIQLDLRHFNPTDRHKFENLVKEADVLIQSYRPGGLTSLGFSPQELVELNPDLVCASLNAWGWSEGAPLRDKKGFDSLVQFACGINEAEGRAWHAFKAGGDGDGGTGEDGDDENEFEPKALPCQALDHGAGYVLAFGVQTALLRRATEGGSFEVTTCLLAMANVLRSLDRTQNPQEAFKVKAETLEELRQRGQTIPFENGFGDKTVETIKHAARIQGLDLDVEFVARSYADSEPRWL
ncbi:hypothetical protein ACM66B_005387 [Microbotryomycetes sp. NB124-2]